MYTMRREPHQPEAKPPVVHTDQSEDYDDRKTREYVRGVLDRADAAIEKSIAEEQATKEKEPMGRRSRNDMGLPMGEQGKTVSAAISANARMEQDVTPTMVWSWLTASTKIRWEDAYGGHKPAYDKLRHAMSNLSYSGKLKLTPNGNGSWKYGGLGKGIPRSKRAKAKVAPQPLPATASTPEGDLGDYTHIGTDLDGLPLYYDQLTGDYGTLVFKPVI